MYKRNENTLPLEERALLNDTDLAQYLSTGRATARKISEEAGAVVKDLDFIGVINKTPLKKDYKNYDAPYDIVPEYALIFKAKFVEFNKEHTHETIDINFFDKDDLPPLSNKLKKEDYLRIIDTAVNGNILVD